MVADDNGEVWTNSWHFPDLDRIANGRAEVHHIASDGWANAYRAGRKLWISFGRHGLYRSANREWRPFGVRQDLPGTGGVAELADALGRVWFGYSNNQLIILDGDLIQIFGASDGVENSICTYVQLSVSAGT
jgi:hypothetical protein